MLRVNHWLILVLLALLAGCDDPAPETRLVFPPVSGTYSGDTLRFRGEVSFNAASRIEVSVRGEDIAPVSVSLNDTDNTFEADVELGGANVLDLTLTTENLRSNNTGVLPVRIDRNAFGVRSTAIVAWPDPDNGLQLVTTDVRLQALISVDSETGQRQILSSEERGLGPVFRQPTALNFQGGMLYLLDEALGVLRIDPLTGDRVLVSGVSVGEGVAFVAPRAMAIRDTEIVVADIGLDALIRVDLSTGDRQQVFAGRVDDDPIILSPKDIAFSSSQALLIADDSWRAIFSIDLVQGTVAVIANFEVGEGVSLALPRALLVANNDDLLVLDGGRDALLNVNPFTGDREIVSNNELSVGPGFDVPVDAALAGDQVFVTDNGARAIFSINLQTGARALISEVRQGQGLRLQAPFDVVVSGEDYILTDKAADALVEIDGGSGDRRILLDSSQALPFPGPDYANIDGNRLLFSYSRFDAPGLVLYHMTEDRAETLAAPGVGAGPLLILPTEPVYRRQTNEYLVFDAFEQHLLTINEQTLERRVLFDDQGESDLAFRNVAATTTNSGGDLWYLLDSVSSRVLSLDIDTGVRDLLFQAQAGRTLVEIEFDGERLLLLDQSSAAILALDITDRVITEISGASRGRGPAFERPLQMSVNSADQLAIVVDGALDAVFMVDLTSGERVIISH